MGGGSNTFYLNVLTSLLIVGVFTGCGVQEGNDPLIEYGGDTEGNNDITRYQNADWLYQNYFGEYGLPNELKSMMMPELQMMANGFALQHAKGEDVEASISQLNTAMTALHYSGKLNLMVQSMQEEYQDGVYSINESNTSSSQDENFTREISYEAQEHIDESNRREEKYKQEQAALVEDYDLPYDLPNKVTKTITYSPAMKSSGGKNNNNNNNNNNKNSFKGIDNWSWWNADFFWVNGAAGIGHMGLIDANNNGLDTVIDSMPGHGVQRHRGVTAYFNDDENRGWTRAEGHYYTEWLSSDRRRQTILNWAYNKVGQTGFGIAVGKNNKSETYCSGLIWQGFRTQGVDLDRDGGAYVLPRDITYHYDVRKFDSQNR